MSKDKRKSIYNIAVVGLSGTEQVKGAIGVGKSCLCNRFVREDADSYYPEHTSVLSQSDFGGRVVNNDHFLYWGEVKKQDDNGQEYTFNIIEQTEFTDDQSYQAHRTSTNQVYCKRSAQTKISSAEKMMYICTDQLGIESDFEAKPMPDGKLTIDGFVLCFDVTNKDIDEQVRFIQHCYHYLAKTKKPVVLALTKCDEAVSSAVKEAEKFAASAGGKKNNGIPVIETSACENVNISLVFLILAQLIDKSRPFKIISFKDAADARKELLKNAKEKLENLLAEKVTSYHETWPNARRILEDKPEYKDYVRLEGKNAASKIFRKHINYLRNEYRLYLQNEYMKFFPKALRKIIPDLSLVKSTWSETLEIMKDILEFKNWFVSLKELDNNSNGLPWYENQHVKSLEDRRIPTELLQTVDAERYFLFHRAELEAKQKQLELKKNFREMLAKSVDVTPGRDWDDVSKSLTLDSVAEISETELAIIYEQYQSEIIEKAKKDFQELLYEKSEIFVSGNNNHTDIHDALKDDARYVAMSHLSKEKNEILTSHISEVLQPSNDNWGARSLASSLKAQRDRLSRDLCDSEMTSLAERWRLTPDSDSLNIVLLGSNGLSEELANEITVHSSEEYNVNGCTHPLRLRTVEGDVSNPATSFKTSSFSPHGCIAVYSSIESLNYIKSSLECTVVCVGDPSENGNVPPFHGLPVCILLASHSNSEQEVHQLRDAGERLASCINCRFIDVPPEYAYNRRFHESQVKLALRSLITGIEERARRRLGDSVKTSESTTENRTASTDLNIIMCTRKDDYQTSEVALAPLLNHASFNFPKDEPEGEETEDTVYVETYLGTQRRRIAVTLTSYQFARNHLNKGSPIHGFILVYDTQLKSSFSILSVFAKNMASSYPLLILCVSPDDNKPAASFFQQDSASRQLVVDGNELADQLCAKFVTASARHRHQSEVYSTFFKDAWDHKEETESIHTMNRAVAEQDIVKNDIMTSTPEQPPVPPPRSINTNLYRNKANSTEQLNSRSFSDFSFNETSVTPPNSLQLITPTDSYENRVDHVMSSWSMGSEDQLDTPNPSPTACLLDNEVDPDYSDYPFVPNRSTPPAQPSHLYPGAGAQPGKLNPELVNKVASVIGKAPANFPDDIKRTADDPPFMPINDHKFAGVKVLPSISGNVASNKKSTQETKERTSGKSNLLTGFELGLHRRSAPRGGMRLPLHSVDIDSPVTTAQTPPTVRQIRHSTADLLSDSFNSKLDIDGSNLSKKSFTSSHENLRHASPITPLGLTSSLASGERVNPKDKVKKMKEEKKKEEKKNKEKEKRFKYKETQKRNLPASVAVGNKHTISDYFNKGLDDVVQSLNHMVPLFVEKCVRYIESTGLRSEGLYRVPANARERERIITRFDEDNNYDLKSNQPTVHTVAGCLTWFFSHKNLPEPLISTHLHEELEEAAGMPTAKNLAIRGVIRKLPYSNYATFKFICSHLKRVSEHSEENKMTVDNLALCWGNTLFRPLMDSTIAIPKPFFKEVLMLCIDQCGFMFFGQPEN